MKNSNNQKGFSSKSLLILLIFVGGIWLIIQSLISGEFLLKGTMITMDESPLYFWTVLFCFIAGMLYILKLFIKSLKGD